MARLVHPVTQELMENQGLQDLREHLEILDKVA